MFGWCFGWGRKIFKEGVFANKSQQTTPHRILSEIRTTLTTATCRIKRLVTNLQVFTVDLKLKRDRTWSPRDSLLNSLSPLPSLIRDADQHMSTTEIEKSIHDHAHPHRKHPTTTSHNNQPQKKLHQHIKDSHHGRTQQSQPQHPS